jgi:hypothetical protein
MEPKTKLQKRVYRNSRRLPSLTKKHEQWAADNLFDAWLYKTNKTNICFNCAHEWSDGIRRDALLAQFTTCPNCKKDLKLTEKKSWRHRDINQFCILTVIDGFQVVRYVEAIQYCVKGEPVEYDLYDIFSHWISPDGKTTGISKLRAMYGYYNFSEWSRCSTLEIRQNLAYNTYAVESYKNGRVIPELKRNGYDGNVYGYDTSMFFRYLLSEPIFETLLKKGQLGLLKSYKSQYDSINKLWAQIKICFKNNYVIEDFVMWKDYLVLLHKFGRDVYSPRWICPVDLNKRHDKLVEKARKLRQKEKLEELKDKIRVDNIKYRKKIKKFLDVRFSNDNIKVVVIKNVKELLKEGDELNHCVFSSNYQNRSNSLLLSARKGKQRIETIEVNLNSMTIEQARGSGNKPTEYHEEIVNLVNQNIKTLKRIKVS